MLIIEWLCGRSPNLNAFGSYEYAPTYNNTKQRDIERYQQTQISTYFWFVDKKKHSHSVRHNATLKLSNAQKG